MNITAAISDRGLAEVKIFADAFLAEGLQHSSLQLPGSDSYETNRKTHFNHDVICHPLLFVRPSETSEVAAAIRAYGKGLSLWKKEPTADGVEVPLLCICGGRHSTRSMKDHAVILDLSLMKNVEVDPEAQTVTVGAGTKIVDMIEALAPHHLAPVTGTHTDTGVIGLVLGGGQGFLSKKYGPAVDQILKAEIVLADGSIRAVQVDNPDDDDIMFNIRGAGGNIGVVTKLTMKVHPVRNLGMLFVVNLLFTQKGVENALCKYGEWSSASPSDCTSFTVMPIGALVLINSGVSCSLTAIRQDIDASQAQEKANLCDIPGLCDLKHNGVGTWLSKSTFSVRSLADSMEELSAEKDGNFYYSNFFFSSITPEIARIFAEAQRGSMGKGVKGALVIFNHAGEKTEEVGPTKTAFEMRDKKYWTLVQTTWTTTGNKEHDNAARERVVKFNRWVRGELLKAGARRTIHPVANADRDYDKTDYGHFLQDVNKARIIRIQNELDPDAIFSANRVVS